MSARVKARTGMSLSEWLIMPWWPRGEDARVVNGPPGHESEIVINYDCPEDVRRPVAEVIIALLPHYWKVEDRGTRIEVHPSGRFAGGVAPGDINITETAVSGAGFVLSPQTPPERGPDHVLRERCSRYRAALERIAAEDYRGPRPESARIAYEALYPEAHS